MSCFEEDARVQYRFDSRNEYDWVGHQTQDFIRRFSQCNWQDDSVESGLSDVEDCNGNTKIPESLREETRKVR